MMSSPIGDVDPNRVQLNRQARAAYEAEQARRAEQTRLEALEAEKERERQRQEEIKRREEEARLRASAAVHRRNIFFKPGVGWAFIVTPTYEDPFGQRPVTRSEVDPAYFSTQEGKELEKQFQAAEQKAVDKAITDYIAAAKSQGILAKDIKAWYDEKTGMVHVQGSNFEPLTTQVQAQAIAGQPQTTYTLKVPSRSDYKTDVEYQQAQKQYSEAQTKLSYEALQNVTKQLQQSGGGTVTTAAIEAEKQRLLQTKYAEGVPVVTPEAQRMAQADAYLNFKAAQVVSGIISGAGSAYSLSPEERKMLDSTGFAIVDKDTGKVLARGSQAITYAEKVRDSYVKASAGQPLTPQDRAYLAKAGVQVGGAPDSAYLTPKPGRPGVYEGFTDSGYESIVLSAAKPATVPPAQFNPNLAEQVWRSTVGLTGSMIAGASDLIAMAVGKNALVNKQISSGLESFAQATRAATGLEGLAKVYETLAGITGQKAYAYSALEAKKQSQAEVPAIDPLAAAAGGIAALAGSAEGKRAVDTFIEQTQKRPIETAITTAVDFFSLGGGSLVKAAPGRVRPFDYAPDIVGIGEKSLLTEKPATLQLTTKSGVVEQIKAPQPTWSWSVRQEVPVYTKPVKGGELRLAEQPTRRPPDADLKEIEKKWQDYAKIPVAISGQTARTFEASESVRQRDNIVSSKSGSLVIEQKPVVEEVMPTTEQVNKVADAALNISKPAETTSESASIAAKIISGESLGLGLGGNVSGYTPTGPLGIGGLTGAERKRFKRPDENLSESNLVYPQQTPDFIKSYTSVPAQQNQSGFIQDTKRLADQALNPKITNDTTSKLSTSSLTAMSTLPDTSATQQPVQAQDVSFEQIQQALAQQGFQFKQSFDFNQYEASRTRTKLMPELPPSVTEYYFGKKSRRRVKTMGYGERVWRLGKIETLLFGGKYTEEPLF